MKVLVAHPQQQHSYRLAEALLRSGFEVCYATTVYNKPGNLTNRALGFLRGANKEKGCKRRSETLQDSQVIQKYELLGLLSLLLYRIDKSRKVYNLLNGYIDKSFGTYVAQYAVKNGCDALVCYDKHAEAAFGFLKEHGSTIVRILDSSAACVPYAIKCYSDDALVPSKVLPESFVDPLSSEKKIEDAALLEMSLSQYCLIPSQFVRKSVEYVGFPESKIFCCPYGSNFEPLDAVNLKKSDGPLNFVFCGKVSVHKGIHRLFEAFEGIDSQQFSLTIMGNYDKDCAWLAKYRNKYNFTGHVLPEQVKTILRKSDIFVFPSLVEGLSLACLEAMASGLLLISTDTGIDDFIENGVDGFVVKRSNVQDLREKIEWCVAHPEEVFLMRKKSLDKAEQITWDSYQQKIEDAFTQIEKSNAALMLESD